MKKIKPDRVAAAQEKQRRKQEKDAKRTALDEIKKEEEDLYPVGKGKILRIARIALWVMIAFIFFKGLMVSIRPDPTEKVNQAIDQFKAEYSGYQKRDTEIMAFAEGFATEYFTYSDVAGVDEYKARLSRYAADSVTAAIARVPPGKTAQVVNVMAYKQESYSASQADIWVKLDVAYTQRIKSADGIETVESTTAGTILRVPVSISGDQYIVEDFPAFANDTMRIQGFKATSFSGREADGDTTQAITEALANFYRAYYESEQAVINYYLSPDADPAKFVGLGGRITFQKISAIRAYYATEGDTEHYRVILTATVTDKNGMELPQNFNLSMVYRDKQYYIVSMNVRNKNIAGQ